MAFPPRNTMGSIFALLAWMLPAVHIVLDIGKKDNPKYLLLVFSVGYKMVVRVGMFGSNRKDPVLTDLPTTMIQPVFGTICPV